MPVDDFTKWMSRLGFSGVEAVDFHPFFAVTPPVKSVMLVLEVKDHVPYDYIQNTFDDQYHDYFDHVMVGKEAGSWRDQESLSRQKVQEILENLTVNVDPKPIWLCTYNSGLMQRFQKLHPNDIWEFAQALVERIKAQPDGMLRYHLGDRKELCASIAKEGGHDQPTIVHLSISG